MMDKLTAQKIRKVGVHTMEHSGYTASLMQTARLHGDRVFGLPPGEILNVIPIHCLPGAPDGWIREAGSYVIPVDSEIGLWFSWTANSAKNTAIITSVKGMNPITGQKMDELKLEQYRDMCPIHKIPFGHGRWCEKCKYNWPPQNYVSSPNMLWWDGFRQPDGTVRQFFFTEDEARDVASAVIGKENTVPAYGFAFFKTKVERVDQVIPGSGVYYNTSWGSNEGSCFKSPFIGSVSPINETLDGVECFYAADSDSGEMKSLSVSENMTKSSAPTPTPTWTPISAQPRPRGATRSITPSFSSKTRIGCDVAKPFAPVEERKAKDVSVGAGAKINQTLDVDPMSIDDWESKPQGLIRLYFVFNEQLETIVRNGGVKEIGGDTEGYLKNVKVG